MPSVFPLTSNAFSVAAVFTAASVVAGCGEMPRDLTPIAPLTALADRGSWMRGDARKEDLLYVSDQRGAVYVFSYPKGRQVGMLTGFASPAGLCSDAAGDVFVVDTDASSILEFAHGGATPVATLHDTSYYPWGCAVDPSTGNLAVTNINAVPSGAGSIAIFSSARGVPVLFSDRNLAYPYLCGYDDGGNLFFSGLAASPPVQEIWELPRGGGSLTTIPVRQHFKQAAGVQWDGHYLAVGHSAVIDRFEVVGNRATLVGTTPLQGAKLVLQFWIDGNTIIGPDFEKGRVGLWNYPQGGDPNRSIGGLPIQLFGSTISHAKRTR